MNLEELRTKMKRLKGYYDAYNTSCNVRGFIKIITTKEFDEFYVWVNDAIKSAPKLLEKTYENLYVLAKTQKAYAHEKNVTEKYIQILNKRLLLFLLNYKKKEDKNEI